MRKTTNAELRLLIKLVSLLILSNQPVFAQYVEITDSLLKQPPISFHTFLPKRKYDSLSQVVTQMVSIPNRLFIADSTKVPGRATKKLGKKFIYIGGLLFLGGTVALNVGADEDLAGRFAGPGFLLLAAGVPMTIFGSATERRFLHKKHVPGRDLKIIGPLLTVAGATWIWWVGTIAFNPQAGEALLVVPGLTLIGAALTYEGIVLWKKGIKRTNDFRKEHSLSSMDMRPSMNGVALRIKF